MSFPDVERAVVQWTRRLSLASGWLLLGVAALTVLDAGLRYALSRPIPGTFELTELVLATVIFFGLPYTGLVDGHVSVDALAGHLPPRGQHALLAGAGLVMAALLAAITWEMGQLAAEGSARTEPRSPPGFPSSRSWSLGRPSSTSRGGGLACTWESKID